MHLLSLSNQGALSVEDTATECIIFITELYLIFRFFRTRALSY
jgi:hypothetical protein